MLDFILQFLVVFLCVLLFVLWILMNPVSPPKRGKRRRVQKYLAGT